MLAGVRSRGQAPPTRPVADPGRDRRRRLRGHEVRGRGRGASPHHEERDHDDRRHHHAEGREGETGPRASRRGDVQRPRGEPRLGGRRAGRRRQAGRGRLRRDLGRAQGTPRVADLASGRDANRARFARGAARGERQARRGPGPARPRPGGAPCVRACSARMAIWPLAVRELPRERLEDHRREASRGPRSSPTRTPPRICSGAMYATVPTDSPVPVELLLVRCVRACTRRSRGSSRARRRPAAPARRGRCCSASGRGAPRPRRAHRSGADGRRPPRRNSSSQERTGRAFSLAVSVSPWRRSIARKISPSGVVPTSISSGMNGLRMRAAASASRWSRAMAASVTTGRLTTLMATRNDSNDGRSSVTSGSPSLPGAGGERRPRRPRPSRRGRSSARCGIDCEERRRGRSRLLPG